MRRAGADDLPEIRAFLGARIDRAMFPLSNLRRFGLDGDHDYAPSFWISGAGAAINAVLTVTRNGTVMPSLGPRHIKPAARVLTGRDVWRVIGPAEDSRPLIAALGLDAAPTDLDRDEPHFALDLGDLRLPDGPGTLRPLDAVDRGTLVAWRADYAVETLGTDRSAATEAGRREIEGYIAADTHRVLVAEDGTPLSITGFNAALPEIVQIGGVYTPPALRGRGHARRAVALHLAEARAAGVARATLFASGAAAVRAYEAIGFRRIGTWTLFLMTEPARCPT